MAGKYAVLTFRAEETQVYAKWENFKCIEYATVELSESLLMCINCLCSTYNLTKFPKRAFHSLCKLPNLATLLCELSRNYQMDSFLKVFVSHLIKVVLSSIVDDKQNDEERQLLESSLLLDLLRDMDVDDTLKMDFARNLLHEYIATRRACGSESGVVINNCVRSLVRIIQNRWQPQMDKTIQDYLVSLRNENSSEQESQQAIQWTQEFVAMALSNVGSQIVCDSGSTLIIALHHPEAEFRKLALKRVSSILKEPVQSHEDKEFLKESLLVKLGDEDCDVVLTVLKLNEGLVNICHGEQLVASLIKLMEKRSSEWTNVFEHALGILLSDGLLEKIPNLHEHVLFHVMPLMFLTRKNVDRAKLIFEHLSKSQLKSEWLAKSLQKKTLRKRFEKCSKDSTSQELAVANDMLICTLAENIALLENESALETIKMMQEHANKGHDQIFVVMFLMISGHLLSIVTEDTQKFKVMSLFLRGLLSLVSRVAEGEGNSKLLQELDEDVAVVQQDGSGIVPIRLMTTYVGMLKKKKTKKIEHVESKMFLCVLEHVIKFLPRPEEQASIWWICSGGNDEERYTKISFAIFEVVLNGLGKGRKFAFHDEFQKCLETFIKVQFTGKLHFLKFLTYVWSNGARSTTELCCIPVPSAIVVVQSLHIAKMMLTSFDEKAMVDMISDQSQVIPSLIVCLTSPVMAVRQTVLQMIALICSSASGKTASSILGSVVCESSEEISADGGFIVSVFQRYFSSADKLPGTPDRRKLKLKKSSGKIQADDVLEYILNHIVNKETPSYVIRVLLATLNKVVTKSFLLRCYPLLMAIVNYHLKHKDCSSDQSQIVLYLIQKFTSRTVVLFKTEPKLFETFLQLFSLSTSLFNGQTTPQEAVLNQMFAEFFDTMTEKRIQKEVFGKLIDVLMDTSDPKISGKLKEVLKLIPISADQIQEELTKVANEESKKTTKAKKARTETSDDWSSSLGPVWQRVVTIIELLQTKDNVTQPENLLPVLFKILSMCLEMSEGTSLDYIRQLVLSTMLKICQTHVDQENVLTRGVFGEEHFSVEQIIHCIRVSANPQTHHHALSLLAIGAQLFPEKVLHNIMSIFTFMGVSVLRQDDTYSFQVIKRTVEAVIPALIRAEKSERNVQTLVIKVLRVFVDAFPHVPEHRRLPIFVHLLTTVGTASYLHVCLALLLEKTSNKDANEGAMTNTKESGLMLCNSLCNEFSPDIQMSSLVNLLKYVGSLPEEKAEGHNRKRYADTSGIIFDVNSHSGKELQQFKLCGIELVLGVLGNDNLVEKVAHLSAEKHVKMDNFYLSLLEETLKYVTSLSKALENINEEPTKKHLRVLLQKVCNIVEKVSDLLPGPTFVSIVSQLIHNNNATIRRKAMELFNKRMAEDSESCSEGEMDTLLLLLDAVIQLMHNEEETAVNKQSAFHTVIVLARLLGDTHSLALKKVITVAIKTFSKEDAKPQVASSALLCLAELCSVLKVHIIPFLSKFLPSVLKIVDVKETEARSDVLLLSALTVIHKVIQSLPNFISPYLKDILVQLMSPKFIQLGENVSVEHSSWKKQIVGRAVSLRAEIAVLIKPRILIPNVSQCYDNVVQNESNESVVVLFQLLSECVTHMSKDDVKNYHNQLLSLFISALDYRSQHGQGIAEDCLLKTEEVIIDAFLSLIMRLSESLFRPMFLKLVDWATRSPPTKLRLLVFYHLADRMAEKLKGLFVLFAGYILKSTASVLDANNITKTEEMFFADDFDEEATAVEKSCQLLRYVLDCLYKCFLYDNQRFVNKERFERLLQPLMDQIENQIGDTEVFHERVNNHLAPCLGQFAAAAGDESYWKTINHHVCLKTRHSSSQVRLAALKVLQELNHKLGEEYLTLLPEIIPFLAELMEDESFEVEQRCQQVISEMENVLGESLQKYF